MTDLHVETVGRGTPVVLVHGSLATGADEWEAQRPLADSGFQLRVPDRRGYGASPSADGEDFISDGADLAELMGDGAHLVGHSYGGLGAMCAAARRPEATLSLALLEPAAFTAAPGDHRVQSLVGELQQLWAQGIDNEIWLARFLAAVGTDLDELPPELAAEAVPLVPLLRRGRTPWSEELPLAELAAASFPKVVVSGGHSEGFDAVCDSLAARIGASRQAVTGAGHEIQFTGAPINDLLLELWRR